MDGAAEQGAAALAGLPGVGARTLERLARLGVRGLGDLLLHLPLRYEDRTRITPLGRLLPGREALVEGEVTAAVEAGGRRRSLQVEITDGSGVLRLRFFHYRAGLKARLRPGVRVGCYGEVRLGPAGLEMVHPEWRLGGARPEPALTPVYPATEGLPQRTLRALAGEALARAGRAETLPAWLREAYGLYPLPDALARLHRPPPGTDPAALADPADPARRRLAFEELLAHQVSLRLLRAQARRRQAPPLAPGGRLAEAFLAALPFELTAAQRRVAEEIGRDLAAPRPMLRLVQGDVGSGKTVVAALAMLAAAEAGWQAALMAPTELLAEQHRANLARWLEPLGLEVVWLGGRVKGAARRAALARIAAGAPAVVGTHALFQDDVRFARLGLVVVDEQHRFGVHQRLALRGKGEAGALVPHQLIMTATPIPRTLAMTAYADLDLSVIDELPPGRTPVRTVTVPAARRGEVVARLRAACAAGRQAYWVCTLVEASEALQAEAAEATAQTLRRALPEVRVGLVHGRMRGEDKERVMRAFAAGEIQLLVATTVIEVGVDVPNATVMVIDNAERLGLAQLHQLRGRVGRGGGESHCVLLYEPSRLGETGRARLAVLRETCDGFEIARRDLALRGPGELLGTRQSGPLALRVADLVRDGDLVPAVQEAAEALIRRDREAAEALVRRWLGGRMAYAEA
ncbi:ATP-dependent DNA helicase RecG [Inmirania thermothiophila]|nr:ATP-dependent DNA helicase RecG [Inmirania thermothiophila]